MTEKSCNGEYDILLLPANGWDRYNEQVTFIVFFLFFLFLSVNTTFC